MSEDFVVRYVAALNSRDWAAAARFMADDVAFEDVAIGVTLNSRAAVEAFLDQSHATFSSDSVAELVGLYGSGPTFAIEWTMSGTHDRDAPTMPATHHPYTIRGTTLAHVRDDMFTSYRDYYDMAGVLRQLGVLPG